MQLGVIGLGRMGANMVRRVIRKGHECVVFDRSPEAIKELVAEKAVGAASRHSDRKCFGSGGSPGIWQNCRAG